MNHLTLLAGALALGFAAPALAHPGHGHGQGGGHGHGHGYGYGSDDGEGRGYGINGPVGYGVGGCPRGLAKKAIACVPPGQARKLGIGQRLPLGYGSPYGYNQIPYNLRSQYGLTPNDNYYYNNGTLYGVDPRTMLIQQVIGALLR